MQATEKFTEVAAVLGLIAPTSGTAAVGAQNTGWMNFAMFHRAFVLLVTGTAGAAGSTLDVEVTQAKDADGTDAKALETAKALTQIAGTDAGAYAGIELQSEMLDVDNGFTHFLVTSTVGTNTYAHSVVVFGTVPRFAPADVTAWGEVI